MISSELLLQYWLNIFIIFSFKRLHHDCQPLTVMTLLSRLRDICLMLYKYKFSFVVIIIIIIITDLYSAFRSEDTEVLDAAQED